MKRHAAAVLLFTLLILGTVTCKKEDPPYDTTPPAHPFISVVQHQVKSFEMVPVYVANTTITADTYTGTLNGATVTLVKTDPQTLGLLIPLEASGEQVLKTELAENSVTLQVTATEKVADPQTYVNDYFSGYKAELNEIAAEYDTLAKYYTFDNAAAKQELLDAAKLYDQYMVDFASLSAEEKTACATYLKANRALIDSITVAARDLRDIQGLKKKSDDACANIDLRWDKMMCYVDKFRWSVRAMGRWIVVAVAAGALGSVAGTPLLGAVITGGIVGLKVVPAFHAAKEAGIRMMSYPYQCVDWEKFSLTKKEQIFENGQPNTLSASIRIRSMEEADALLPGRAGRFIKLWQEIHEDMGRILHKALPAYFPPMRQMVISPETQAKISVETDNVNVKGEVKSGTATQVVFSTRQIAPQSFKYRLVYKAGEEEIKTDWQESRLSVSPIPYIDNQITMTVAGKNYLNLVFDYVDGDGDALSTSCSGEKKYLDFEISDLYIKDMGASANALIGKSFCVEVRENGDGWGGHCASSFGILEEVMDGVHYPTGGVDYIYFIMKDKAGNKSNAAKVSF